MKAFFISMVSIATAEFGDKTQLLVFILASRFKKPIIIALAILAATLINHSIAGIIGAWIGKNLSSNLMHIILAISFIIAAIWILVPDKIEENKQTGAAYLSSIFFTVMITFFLAEIGDKTQIATAMLAAQFHTIIPVVVGTTCGILIANIPAIFLGHKAFVHVPLKPIRILSAIIFAALGCLELLKLF